MSRVAQLPNYSNHQDDAKPLPSARFTREATTARASKLLLFENRPRIIAENIARKLRGNAEILIIAENIARKLRCKLPLGRPRSHV